MAFEYGTRTLPISALGCSVLESHQTVFTASLARIFRLLTHSMGDGNFDGLYQ